MKSRIKRPGATTVIALIALVAAIGGGSYAGAASMEITSRDLADGTIKNRDVADNAIGGNKIREGSLGKVESAYRADTAGFADNAGAAETANRAVSAETATSAEDAGTVGGLGAADLTSRWVLVGADGTIQAQSGGFSLVNCYLANANCYIDAGSDVTDNGIDAEIATANNPDAGTDVLLSGETSAAACFLSFVNCGPTGTDTGNGGNSGVFVVTPRNSDGSAPTAGDRYPFYAFISE